MQVSEIRMLHEVLTLSNPAPTPHIQSYMFVLSRQAENDIIPATLQANTAKLPCEC